MAKFNADITKDANVAMASPEGLMRAHQGTAQMLETAVQGIRTGLKMRDDAAVADVEKQAREAQSIFYNEAVEQPAALKSMGDAASKENEQRAFGSGMDSPASMAEMTAVKNKVNAYQEALNQGKIGLSAYQTRVETLARQAIAANPHLGMQIRETLLKTTGLPYVDRETTAAYYTQQLFQQRGTDKSNDPSFALKKDIENISTYTGITQEKLLAMRTSDPAAYDELAQRTGDSMRVASRATQLGNVRKAAEQTGWQSAGDAGTTFLGIAGTGVMKDLSERFAANKELFAAIKGLDPSKPLASVPGLEAQLGVFRNQIESSIKQQTLVAKQRINNLSATMSSDDVKAQLERVDRQEKLWMQMADPENLAVTLSIMSKHRDKTIEERMKISQQYASFATAFIPSDFMKAYLGGNQQLMDEIEAVAPGSVKLIKGVFDNSGEALAANAADITRVGVALKDAGANPEPTPIPSTATRDEYLEQVNVVTGNLIASIRTLAKAEGISESKANEFGTVFSNMSAGSAAGKHAWQNQDTYMEVFNKIPPDKQAQIKDAVAKVHVAGKNAMLQDLKAAPQLKLGNQPNGNVVVMPPSDMLLTKEQWVKENEKLRKSVPTYGGGYTPPPMMEATYFKKYGQTMYVKPGMEREYEEYEQATRKFENNFLPTLGNLVITRAILEGKPTTTIGKDLAVELQGRKTPTQWFSNAPVAVETPAKEEKPSGGKGFYSGTQELKGSKIQPGDSDKVAVLRNEIEDTKARILTAPDEAQRARLQSDLRVLQQELKKAGG